MTTNKIKLLYPELSYKIIGNLFDVYNELGGGYPEQFYQRVVAKRLKKMGIKFKEQLMVPLEFDGEKIGRYFLDFLIEDKIVLELKVLSGFHLKEIRQVLGYLKTKKLKLGILASFAKEGLIFKRIINIYDK